MNRFLTFAVLGATALALTASQASAGWLHNWCYKKRCCKTISCQQYNAFSPYCCDVGGGYPLPYGCAGGSCSGYANYAGEMPATVEGGAYAASSMPLPAGAGHAVAPGTALPQSQTWMPNMMNPSGVPSYYPGYAGGVPQYLGR
jgi:hypothetical protein